MKHSNFCLACLLVVSLPGVADANESKAQAINPASLPPAHGYSHVIIAPSGRLVSISGQVAIDKNGTVVGVGDFETQCVQVFENLKIALKSANLTFENVVRTDMYVTDLEHLDTLRKIRARYLPKDAPPTSTLVQVNSLYRPELLIEIAVEAVLPKPALPDSAQKDPDGLR